MLAFSCFGGNAAVCQELVRHFNNGPGPLHWRCFIHSMELFSFIILKVLHFLVKIQQDNPFSVSWIITLLIFDTEQGSESWDCWRPDWHRDFPTAVIVQLKEKWSLTGITMPIKFIISSAVYFFWGLDRWNVPFVLQWGELPNGRKQDWLAWTLLLQTM